MNVVEDIDCIRMVGSAYRKTGRRVVLVPLGKGVHAGHLALIQAARRIRGAVVVVALSDLTDVDVLGEVDVVWHAPLRPSAHASSRNFTAWRT